MSTLRQIHRSKDTGEFYLMLSDAFTLCPYTFFQDTPSTEWVVKHNNDSTNIGLQVFVNDEQILPDQIIIDNSNQFRIILTSAQAGYINFVVYKQGDSCGVIETI
jgi:hypothetical protein